MTAVKQVVKLIKSSKYDLFFNLCDGGWDEDRAGEEVVRTLEKFNVPFTGASSIFYEPSKENMKKICHYYGVKTPRFHFCYNTTSDIDICVQSLKFPLIVKQYNGGNSVGMTANSKVDCKEDLHNEVERFCTTYGGALVEEYISGDEYSVFVMEDKNDSKGHTGKALWPGKVVFPQGETFKHFDLKWVNHNNMKTVACDNEELGLELMRVSELFFKGCRGQSFGRCDLRVDEQTGEVYMLEINPNCSIFYRPGMWGTADDLIQIEASRKGSFFPNGHADVVKHLIDTALVRHKTSQLPFDVSFQPGELNFGMKARRDISSGEIINHHEARPSILVSKKFVDKNFSELEKTWFAQNAHPASASGRLYYIWHDEPDKWHPINHSCDPNAILDGLNLVARRDIQRSEAITMDYCTFCDETMQDFDCMCGEVLCRGRVSGLDWQRSELQEKYSGHFSDALQTRVDNFNRDKKCGASCF